MAIILTGGAAATVAGGAAGTGSAAAASGATATGITVAAKMAADGSISGNLQAHGSAANIIATGLFLVAVAVAEEIPFDGTQTSFDPLNDVGKLLVGETSNIYDDLHI